MRSCLMTNYLNLLSAKKKVNIDDVIRCLYSVEVPRPVLSEGEIDFIIEESRRLLLSQPTLLELEAPVTVCGAIHGQFRDLTHIFQKIGYPPDCNYLFLGNYVDRGENQIECICLLLAYKIKYPENFFLLRGRHESEDVNRMHGFFDECKKRYSVEIWKNFNDLFNCLPLAAVIEDKIFCCDGGPSPELHSFKQILRVRRPAEIPETGFICHLIWAEPDEDEESWGESYNGTGITFGKKVLKKFLRQHELDVLCRSQLVQDGYDFFADKSLVNIFSASNFAKEFENAGAAMLVDVNLKITFRVFVKLRSDQEIVTLEELDKMDDEIIIKPFYKSKTMFIKEKKKIKVLPTMISDSETAQTSNKNDDTQVEKVAAR